MCLPSEQFSCIRPQWRIKSAFRHQFLSMYCPYRLLIYCNTLHRRERKFPFGGRKIQSRVRSFKIRFSANRRNEPRRLETHAIKTFLQICSYYSPTSWRIRRRVSALSTGCVAICIISGVQGRVGRMFYFLSSQKVVRLLCSFATSWWHILSTHSGGALSGRIDSPSLQTFERWR